MSALSPSVLTSSSSSGGCRHTACRVIVCGAGAHLVDEDVCTGLHGEQRGFPGSRVENSTIQSSPPDGGEHESLPVDLGRDVGRGVQTQQLLPVPSYSPPTRVCHRPLAGDRQSLTFYLE